MKNGAREKITSTKKFYFSPVVTNYAIIKET